MPSLDRSKVQTSCSPPECRTVAANERVFYTLWELTVDKILGHASDVRGAYYVTRPEAMRDALATLSLE